MTTTQILALARKNLDTTPENEASARLCLSDAVAMFNQGYLHDARGRALRSLSYSLGILHPDYQRAAK